MSIITNREQSLEIIERLRNKKVSMAIFCTASHWNTEAILIGASRFAKNNNIKKIPLAISMTYNYPYMPQSPRVTYIDNARCGFISIMDHMKILCGENGSPYEDVLVLPHLDHGDPARDEWAMTEGLQVSGQCNV